MLSARGSRVLAAWSYRKFLVNLAGIRPLSRIDDTPHTRSLRNPPDRRRLAALDGLLRWRIGTGSGSRVPRAQGRLLLDRRGRRSGEDTAELPSPRSTLFPYTTLFRSADLQRSMAFYGGVLGLDLARVFPERKVAFYWIGGSGKAMLGLCEVGSGPPQMKLHLA